jgi:hypothetical protein
MVLIVHSSSLICPSDKCVKYMAIKSSMIVMEKEEGNLVRRSAKTRT